MADIVVTPVDVVVTPDAMVTLQPKGAVVVPNGWSVVPSGGAMPQYEGVNAAVEARILQAESGMQASLDAKTAQLLSDIQDVETGLSLETETRASEDEALAIRIDTEVARIDDNVAAVQSGVVTNANNHSSLATQFDTYVAKTDSAIASANQEITVVAGKADANASAIGEMQVVMDGREASYAEAIELTITKLYEHFFYPVVPADLPTDYVAGDYLKFGYDYDASHPAGTVIHALYDCAGTFDLADWETPADQTVPRQYTASSTKIETLEADTVDLSARISTEEKARADGDSAISSRVTTLEAATEDIDVRLTSTEEVTAGYFHVWDGTEPLQIGMKRIYADGTTWTYLGGNLGENSDGWVKDNPQDDIAVTRKLNDVNTAIFNDNFDYADGTDLKKFYTLQRGDGDITFLPSTPESVGGKIMHIGDNSGDDDNWLTWNDPIPFDPNKLYKITVRVRRVSGAGTMYLGLAGVAADRKTFVNIYGNDSYGSQHSQVVANYSPADDQFHTLVGYLKGHSPAGVDGTYGSTTIDAPGTMHEDVRYFVPWILANYAYQAGEWEVDFFEVEDYTYTKELDDAYKEYNRVVALAIADGTLTAEEQALIAHAQAAVDEAKAKLNDAIQLEKSQSNLLKWGNPTDAGTGWYYGDKEYSTRFKRYVFKQAYRSMYEGTKLSGLNTYHMIPCVPGEKIYISGWINTLNVSAGVEINIGAMTGLDGLAGGAWPTIKGIAQPGHDWTYFEVEWSYTGIDYDTIIPYLQLIKFDVNGNLVWTGAELGYALWSDLVYSRTPFRSRVDQVAGWAAGASSLITDPNGNITGWSYGDGSNTQSQFRISAENFYVTGTTSDYEMWVSSEGLKFRRSSGESYTQLKKILSGTAQNDSIVTLSGFYDIEPSIMISPRSIKTYSAAHSVYDQTVECSVVDLTGSTITGDWTFRAVAILKLSDGSIHTSNTLNGQTCAGGTANTLDTTYVSFSVNACPSDGDVFTYSSAYDVPANTVGVDITASIKHGYYYRNNGDYTLPYSLHYKVQGYNGSSWVDITAYTKIGDFVQFDSYRYSDVSISGVDPSGYTQLRLYFKLSHTAATKYNSSIYPACYRDVAYDSDTGVSVEERWQIEVVTSTETANLSDLQIIDQNGILNWEAIR
ncbi:hypothetical protein [Hydrogenimonas sp.]